MAKKTSRWLELFSSLSANLPALMALMTLGFIAAILAVVALAGLVVVLGFKALGVLA
jgi:hypothetical protein